MTAWRPAAAIAAVLVIAGAANGATPARATLADQIEQTATHFCYDVISGARAWPAAGPSQVTEEQKRIGEAGLTYGLTDSPAAQALMNSGLLNQAVLASASAADGAFIVALGGPSQGCRIFVHSAADAAALKTTLVAALPSLGWREAPGSSTATMDKHMFLRRAAAGQPYLINLLAPSQPAGGIILALTVVPVPASVALPEGF